jgi:hypothetical protein
MILFSSTNPRSSSSENLRDDREVANPDFWQPEVDSIKPEIDATTDMNEDEGEEEVKTLEDLQTSINRFHSLLSNSIHTFIKSIWIVGPRDQDVV